MSRRETYPSFTKPRLLDRAAETLDNATLLQQALPEDLHSLLYKNIGTYKAQEREGSVSPEVARVRRIADLAFVNIWLYAVERHPDEPEHLARSEVTELLVAQMDDPEVTDELVDGQIDTLLSKRGEGLIVEIPPSLYLASEDEPREGGLSFAFNRAMLEQAREELEFRRMAHIPLIQEVQLVS